MTRHWHLLVMLVALSLIAGLLLYAQEPVRVFNPPPTWQRFNAQFQGKWKADWNPLTGTPHRITGHSLPLQQAISQQNAESVTRSVVRQYREVLQADPESLTLASAKYSKPKTQRSRGTWYIEMQQNYRGIPVEGGNVRMVVRDQNVTMLGSDFYPGINLSVEPAIDLSTAKKTMAFDLRLASEQQAVANKLVILPRSNGTLRYSLAWRIISPVVRAPRSEVVPDQGLRKKDSKPPQDDPNVLMPAQWLYYIDAATGEIISRRNLMIYDSVSGHVTGIVHALVPSDAPTSTPLPHVRATVTQGMTTVTGNTDASGNYTASGLSNTPATVTSNFTNDYVVVHNGEAADCSYSASVTPPATHSWDFDTYDTTPNDVQTNAFYHVGRIRDWFLRGDPFDVSLPGSMNVTVRDGAYCNASSGGTDLYFGSGTGSCSDFALCADIIYHEYTHSMVDVVYGAIPFPYSGQTGAMNEGWADFFAVSMTNNPNHGAGCYGGRNIDTPDKRFPDDWEGEVHADSVMFSGSLYDLRAPLGADYVASMAMNAMKTHATSYADYLNAVLQEDDDPAHNPNPSANNDLSDGTPNIDAICHSYYDIHGIWDDACAGHSISPVAIITSPSPMSWNLNTGVLPSLSIIGTAGPSTSGFQNFVLEYSTESAPATWLTAGMTLSGGGTSPVSAGVLGNLSFAGLADGFYQVRLTVNDSSAHTASVTTSFVLDRKLHAGWPQAPDVHFYGAPAVAELDSAAPGREIVAAGSDGYLHAWHADGTSITGWPVYVGYPQSNAVAIADIDRDDTPEIVFANYYGQVRVFRPDGTLKPGWPVVCGSGSVRGTPALGDIDGDGKMEIVVASTDNKVCAFHPNATVVAGWPFTASAELRAAASVGDLNNDGKAEVVISAIDGNVYALKGDGTAVPGWPQSTGAEISASAALGDANGDGSLEVAVAGKNSQMYLWKADGTAVAGWPKPTTQLTMNPSSAAMADLDGDGHLEIVNMENGDHIQVWRADGTELTGWPPSGSGLPPGWYELLVSSPSVGDIDGVGQEAIAEFGGEDIGRFFVNKVQAFKADASSSWIGRLGSYSNSSPVIADIDYDGHANIVIGAAGIYAWEPYGAELAQSSEWPTFRHDLRRTGTYAPKAEVVLLFDRSGSMGCRHDGACAGVPVDQQKITKAKEAAYPFLQMLNDFNLGKAKFEIASFPAHPLPDCTGEVLSPMITINDASEASAVGTTIPGLTPTFNTPMLAGIELARTSFNPDTRRAIVMLSDGYHNCPTFVSPSDTSVTGLISKLNSDSIRLFTIGFGMPTDIDHPLLQAFANGTTPLGSPTQFFDVTGPGFDPLTFDPGTALQATYKSILVDALGLQSATDPFGVILGGQKVKKDVNVGDYDHRVAFFVSWATSKPKRLKVSVLSADGVAVPESASGISVHNGNTYTILTVGPEFLRQPNKIGPNPWTIQLDASEIPTGVKEKYQYSVITDSPLKLQGKVTGTLFTGDKMVFTATVTENDKPVKGLTDVTAHIVMPTASIGSWLTVNRPTPAAFERVAKRPEPLNTVQKRAYAIRDGLHVNPPAGSREILVRLYDDGTHGDKTANDGIYTADWSGASVEGPYTIRVVAQGKTNHGAQFQRDTVMHKRVTMRVSPTHSPIRITPAGLGLFKVTVTPRDAYRNYLGPGRVSALQVRTKQGLVQGTITDNGDGTYSQIVKLRPSLPVRVIEPIVIERID